jgi:2-polyprenyl-3-methyl-5-hydroxy-6-metoxy-1,4-benzoquinol methylase
VADYVLDHHRAGERERLALMSRLLDPMHRRYLEGLGVQPGMRSLEVGCGNGSISAWLGERTAPGGMALAVDLDLSLVDTRAPNVEFRHWAWSRSRRRLRQRSTTAGPRGPGIGRTR